MRKKRGAFVPAAWAAYNGIWLVLLAALGGSQLELWLYGGSIALTTLFAAALVVSAWRRRGADVVTGPVPLPTRSESAIMAAGGLTLVAAGFAFGGWLFPLGATLVVWALVLAHLDVKHRHRPPA